MRHDLHDIPGAFRIGQRLRQHIRGQVAEAPAGVVFLLRFVFLRRRQDAECYVAVPEEGDVAHTGIIEQRTANGKLPLSAVFGFHAAAFFDGGFGAEVGNIGVLQPYHVGKRGQGRFGIVAEIRYVFVVLVRELIAHGGPEREVVVILRDQSIGIRVRPLAVAVHIHECRSRHFVVLIERPFALIDKRIRILQSEIADHILIEKVAPRAVVVHYGNVAGHEIHVVQHGQIAVHRLIPPLVFRMDRGNRVVIEKQTTCRKRTQGIEAIGDHIEIVTARRNRGFCAARRIGKGSFFNFDIEQLLHLRIAAVHGVVDNLAGNLFRVHVKGIPVALRVPVRDPHSVSPVISARVLRRCGRHGRFRLGFRLCLGFRLRIGTARRRFRTSFVAAGGQSEAGKQHRRKNRA